MRPDAIAIAPRIARHYGEPFADSSAIPSFYLAEMTRRHVTVALNGDGGDESFAGYTRYAANVLAARLERVPLPLRRLGAGLAARLPESAEEQSARNRIRRLGGSLALDGPGRYERYVSLFDSAQRARLYSDEYREGLGSTDVVAEAIAEPWREASGGRSPRPAARGRRPHLPARRPADQDRHRDDGPLAGGALALPRPRDDAVRGLDSGADEAARAWRRR